MTDSFECEECGEEFDSERGLHVHEAQVHDEEEVEKEDNTMEDESSETERNDEASKNFPVDKRSLQIPVELALFSVFVLGVAVGLSTGILAAGSGLGLGDLGSAPAPSNGDSQGSPSNNNGGSGSSLAADLSLEGDPVLGDENAPVTIVMWEDFECPYCKRFEDGAFTQIKNNFVDTGKVKMVWKDFPLPQRVHPWAQESAVAMECVYREGGDSAFWNLKSKIYDNQNTLSESTVQDQIKAWASQEGVNKSAIQSCIDSGVSNEIQQDMSEGQKRGISGTPGFLIYKSGSDSATKVVGAQPYSRFKDVINSKLN